LSDGPVPAPFEDGITVPPLPRAFASRRPSSPWLHAGLLLATLVSTTLVGAVLAGDAPFSFALLARLVRHPAEWGAGLPYSLSALFILGCHEMGHYVACRVYRIEATLPYFLPGPNLFGTFGAVIRIRAPFPTRRALFDVGVAGPIAGFVALLPVLAAGLALSTPTDVPPAPGEIALPSCLLLSILYPLFFDPAQGASIHLHPLFVAAWFGLFATSLNLLPIGQLDGGHMLYAVSPRAHAIVSRLGSPLLVLFGILTGGAHLVLFGILFWLLGLRHPRPLDEIAPLGAGRAAVALFGLLLFVLTFFPMAPQVFGLLLP
jgi:membrane-associated protease RseP (regulator of RpoE activity)